MGAKKLQPDIKFQTSTEVGSAPASNNKRIIAFFIDSAISTFCMSILKVAFRAHSPKGVLIVSALSLVVYLFYWVGLPFSVGSTPGKKLMGLRIANGSGTGDPTISNLILRETIGRFFSIIVFGLGYVFILKSPTRQGWHDKIGSTTVIE